MARVLRMFNLGAGGNPAKFIVDTLPLPGEIGGVYEDNSMNAWQLWQVKDANLSDKNLCYVKSYDGSFTATPTVANSSRNEVAGFNTTGSTITANQYALLQQRGLASVAHTGTDGPAGARGSQLIADRVATNQTDSRAVAVAVVTNTNNVETIGIAQGAAAGGNISAYLKINPY